jgi:hypothetical protein
MASKPGEAADRTIKSLSDRAKVNKKQKSELKFMEGGYTSLKDAAKNDDAGLGGLAERALFPTRTQALRDAGIAYGKGTSLKQVEKKGGIFSNLSPDQEKLMTRAQNAKMKASAIAKAKSKIGKKE